MTNQTQLMRYTSNFNGNINYFLQNIYGIDPCGPLPDTTEEADNVAIPTCLTLTEEQQFQLTAAINPLCENTNDYITIY